LSLTRLLCSVGAAALALAVPAHAAGAPKLGKTALVSEVSGTATFVKKGQTRVRDLSESPALVPMGSSIDATRGKVRVRTAGEGRGIDQATLWKGAFGIRQDKQERVPEMVLLGEVDGSGCVVGPSGSAPRLWADTGDRFRTVGRYSGVEAEAEDTRWLTEDLCDGTRYFVKSGKVRAWDGPVIENPVESGQTLKHFCDYDGVESVSSWFCTMLLSAPHLGVYVPGIATLGTATSYDVCVTDPAGAESCESFPLSEPFTAEGHRFSVATCSAEGGPGDYSLRWLIDGVQLGPAVPFTSDRPPGQDCAHRP
jgi:hypothetical protein